MMYFLTVIMNTYNFQEFSYDKMYDFNKDIIA